MADRIQLRRDTSTNWSAANPVLASGEQGFETDTLKLKIGNGVSAWNSLAYVIDVSSLATSADVTSAVNNLVDAAPGTLDTLNELAAALGDDANFASTVTSSLALKADTTAVTSSLALKADTTAVTSSLALKADASSLATVATSGDYADVTGTPSIPSALTDLSITDGVEGQVLTTDGSGGFAFADTAGGGGSFEATTGGAMSDGDPVVIQSDGTVVKAGISLGLPTTNKLSGSVNTTDEPDNADGHFIRIPGTTTAVVLHRARINSAKQFVSYLVNVDASGVVTKISTDYLSNVMAASGADAFLQQTDNVNSIIAYYDTSINQLVFGYLDLSSNGQAKLVVNKATVNSDSLSWGSATELPLAIGIHGAATSLASMAHNPTNNELCFAVETAQNGQSTNFHYIYKLTNGATTLSELGRLGTPSQTNEKWTNSQMTYVPWVDAFAILVHHQWDWYSTRYNRVQVHMISGSIGAAYDIYSSNSPSFVRTQAGHIALDTTNQKLMIMYYTGTGYNQDFNVKYATAASNYINCPSQTGITISGVGVTGYGSQYFNVATTETTNQTVVVLARRMFNDSESHYKALDLSYDPVTAEVVKSDEYDFDTASGLTGKIAFAAPMEDRIVVSTFNPSRYWSVISIQPPQTTTNVTNENFVGISDGDYADGETATIQTAGAVDDAQSGLTAGQAYFLQPSGSLVTVPGTPRVFAGVALSATELMIGKDLPADAVVTYTDSDVATYLSGNDYATKTATIAAITDSAPATLDTLNELAAALGDDANFAGTVTTSLAAKANTADLSTVATTGAYSDLTGTPVPGGSFEAVASGTLENGDKVVINADGTISVVSQTVVGSIVESVSLLQTLDNPNAYDTSTDDQFGWSVAISGNYAIVGAYGEDDASGTRSGKAYIFNVSTGALLHTLNNSNPYNQSTSNEKFGYAVALSDNYAFVGVPGNTSGGKENFGEVQIYDLTTGALVRILTNPNPYGYGSQTGNDDQFGNAIAISGNYAIVCAYTEDDDDGTNSGKAYIFDVTTGVLLRTLNNPNANDTSAGDNFGRAVAMSGNYAIVSAPYEDGTGDNWNSGYAYIFDVTTGALLHSLDNPNAYRNFDAGIWTGQNDNFGTSVAISGNYAIVSATGEDDADGTNSGKAYIFDVTTGALVHTLDNPNPYGTSANDYFGNSVAITDKLAIVSAPYEDDATGLTLGKTYFFDITTGALVHTLDNPNAYDTSAGDQFGFAVATSGDYIIVSAPHEDDAGGTSSGKAYIFDTDVVVSTTTNLTTENYAGIADASYADGATATIQTAGAVDDAQSGLTAGQAYFLQEDGTLNTTPDSTRVFAGVALSATELMIGKDLPADAVVTYTDSDVATYLSGNGYDTATNIISTITDSAPATLDTLNELAAALGDDANFAGTVTTSLAAKANTADLATVATSGSYNDLTDQPVIAAGGGSFEAVASGSLSDGSTVALNSDGTVSVVAETSSPLDKGSTTTFTSTDIYYMDSVFDSNSNKVVVAYSNFQTGNLMVQVGTVSGDNITFGSPVVGASGHAYYLNLGFDSTSNKVILSYSESSVNGYGVAKVGTVSGNSISFGTATVFKSASVLYFSSVFVAASSKFIIGYTTGANAELIVGTVSGSSISFGGAIQITGASKGVAVTFDSNANKVVCCYTTTDYLAAARVGSISGDSISLGSEVTHNAGRQVWFSKAVFDSNSNKVIAVHSDRTNYDGGTGYFGVVFVGTVSGDSISFGPYTPLPAVGPTLGYHGHQPIALIFDSNKNKLVFVYGDSNNSSKGTVAVGQVSGSIINFDSTLIYDNGNTRQGSTAVTFNTESNKPVVVYSLNSPRTGKGFVISRYTESVTNLTAGNYIGISDASYSDGATATIQIVGSVDDAQSGLTPGQSYYVQVDGTLAVTPSTPSVFAGTAVSTTKLIVKG